MGSQNITGAKSAGDTMDQSWYNDLRGVLVGALLPRSGSSGAVASGSDLGSNAYPWGTLYASTLNIGGQVIDFGNLTGSTNSISSGAVRSTSNFPDFLRADGAAAAFDVLGSTTSLVLNINGTSVTISSNITKSSLTVAPSSNNTATINDGSLTDQESSKWQGEDNTTIIISSAGTEITNRIGQYCAFKKDTEYFLAYIKSATELTNAYRGFFFDSSGNPIDRVTLANSDTITLMSTGWVFVENDATTVDVAYTTPIYSMTEPSSPATGDYWYDLDNSLWKRYNGSAFVQINRTLVGMAVIDATNCVATRSFNFANAFVAHQPIKLEYVSATSVKAMSDNIDIDVYGLVAQSRFTPFTWDIATHLESGQTEAANTTYFAYVTQGGEKILSHIKPYDQRAELKGWYHPYNAWRCVGYIANNGSSDFDSSTLYTYYNENALNLNEQDLGNLIALAGFGINNDELPYFNGSGSATTTSLTSFARSLLDDSSAANARATLDIASPSIQVFTSSGTWSKPTDVRTIKVTVVGGGGGQTGAGGTSSFGSFCSANGGARALGSTGGAGGTASGGDFNQSGQDGGYGFTAPNNGAGNRGALGGSSAFGLGNGAAGSSYTNAAQNAGGGGGGGAIEYIDVTSTSSVSVTVGAAGSGGDSTNGVVIIEEM